MATIAKNNILYNQMINAWSLRNFIPTNDESVRDHFFDSFYKYLPIVNDARGEILAELSEQAAFEHVQYWGDLRSPSKESGLILVKSY